MNAYSFFVHLHSGFRYLVFILVVLAIVFSLIGWLRNGPFTAFNKRINLFALIAAHTQLLIGIVLLFISPYVQFNSSTMKNSVTRYFTVEHWVGMLIAIILITIGYSKSKKVILPIDKHKTVAIYYLIAIVIIIATILAGHIPLFGEPVQ